MCGGSGMIRGSQCTTIAANLRELRKAAGGADFTSMSGVPVEVTKLYTIEPFRKVDSKLAPVAALSHPR